VVSFGRVCHSFNSIFYLLRANSYLTSSNLDTREQAICMIRNLAFPKPDLEYLRRNLGDLPLFEAVEQGMSSESSEVVIQVSSVPSRLAGIPEISAVSWCFRQSGARSV
jgi:hypothetical protein